MSWQLYLSEVLGTPTLIGPLEGWVVPSLKEQALDPMDLRGVAILFIAEPHQMTLLENDLFLKMVAAMKTEPGETAVWEIDPVELATRESAIPDSIVVVSFSEKLGEWLAIQRSRLQVLVTPHPDQVAQQPQLKRQVWEDLKSALVKAKLSVRL